MTRLVSRFGAVNLIRRDRLFTGDLPFPPQTQHMLCMFTTTRVTHAGLTGKEWLEAFSL